MSQILRCSSLDQVFACGPSVLDDEGLLRIETGDDDASDFGKLVHALGAQYIEKGEYDARAECDRRGMTPPDDLGFIMGRLIRTWEDKGRFFKTPACERRVTSKTVLGGRFKISGTLDVAELLNDTTAIFGDWKSGYKVGHKHQMFGYAWALWDFMGRPANVTIKGFIAYLRHGFSRTVTYTADALAEWQNDLERNVLGRRTYRIGDHCATCPIFHACAARQEMTSSTVGALLLPNNVPADDKAKAMIGRATAILGSITPDNKNEPEVREALTELRFRVKLLEKVIDAVKDMQRATVERVGPISLTDETELTIRTVERKEIDPLKALRTLRTKLADNEIAEAMKLSLPALKKAYAAKFLRGEKGKAAEQLEKELEAIGALIVSASHRLEEVDTEREEDEERGTPLRLEGRDAGSGAAVRGERG